MNRIGRILCLSAVLFLSACSSVPNRENETIWDGRFSVKRENPHGVERDSGNFRFSAAPELSQLTISGPLGASLASIEETASQAKLTSGSGVTHAQNSRILLENIIGFPLSLRDLQSWLEGQPLPSLLSDNWKLEISKNTDGQVTKIHGKGYLPETRTTVVITLLPRKVK